MEDPSNHPYCCRTAANKQAHRRVQDVLDLMTDPGNDGARHLLLHRGQLADAFFNLRSGLPGEIFQKFVTYGLKLAILGNFSQHPSRSFRDFVRECKQGHQIYFLPDSRTALESLTRNGDKGGHLGLHSIPG